MGVECLFLTMGRGEGGGKFVQSETSELDCEHADWTPGGGEREGGGREGEREGGRERERPWQLRE